MGPPRAGPGTARRAADPARPEPGKGGSWKPHPRAGSLPRQAQQQPSSESSRPRSRASSAPAPITPFRWLVSVGVAGSARCRQPPRPRRVALTHSPRRQAPVTGSHESSWQLQAWAQSTPWSPGGQVRLQLRGREVREGRGVWESQAALGYASRPRPRGQPAPARPRVLHSLGTAAHPHLQHTLSDQCFGNKCVHSSGTESG